MATFSERLDAARQAREAEVAAAAQQEADAVAASWNATVAQLKALVASELELDSVPEVERLDTEYSHGRPATTYALVKADDDFWFALPLSRQEPPDMRLLALVHCANGHVQYTEYPTSADDDWERALLRVEDQQALYADASKCGQCVADRNIIRSYQARPIGTPVPTTETSPPAL